MIFTDRAYFSKSLGAKRPHFHDCHQVILIKDGQAEFEIDGRLLTARAGDAVILSRFENHSVKILSEQYARYVLHVDPMAERQQGRVYQFLSNRPAGFENVVHLKEDAPRLMRLFERIISESGSGLPLCDRMQALLTDELLIELYRIIGIDTDCSEREVYELQALFEREYAEKYTLDALAKKYNMSVSSLSHRFKRVTGTAVMEYLAGCRLAQAKRLLVSTTLGVDEVVSSCGFSDSCNFCRSFKAQTGMTPSAFRKEYKKQR